MEVNLEIDDEKRIKIPRLIVSKVSFVDENHKDVDAKHDAGRFLAISTKLLEPYKKVAMNHSSMLCVQWKAGVTNGSRWISS